MSPAPVNKALLAFCSLVCVQVLIGLVYRLSQSNGKYDYSPASALTVSEFIKLCLSSILFYQSLPLDYHGLPTSDRGFNTRTSLFNFNKTVSSYKAQVSPQVLFAFFGLAVLYALNNNLNFLIFRLVDPGNVNLIKSASTLVSASILRIFLSRQLSTNQWVSILIQSCGLIITQYDPCKGRVAFEPSSYLLLFISLLISSVCGVWNDHVTKTFKISLHAQNMTMYIFGFFINLFIYCFQRFSGRSSKGFFQGYSGMVFMIIFLNSIIGIIIAAVYKYADAVVKTIALSVTTGILLLISSVLFSTPLTVTSVAGCVVVFSGTYMYFATSIVASKAKPSLATPISKNEKSQESSNSCIELLSCDTRALGLNFVLTLLIFLTGLLIASLFVEALI